MAIIILLVNIYAILGKILMHVIVSRFNFGGVGIGGGGGIGGVSGGCGGGGIGGGGGGVGGVS